MGRGRRERRKEKGWKTKERDKKEGQERGTTKRKFYISK